jgi:hypothetical protein
VKGNYNQYSKMVLLLEVYHCPSGGFFKFSDFERKIAVGV